jgi:heat shock protein HslJ
LNKIRIAMLCSVLLSLLDSCATQPAVPLTQPAATPTQSMPAHTQSAATTEALSATVLTASILAATTVQIEADSLTANAWQWVSFSNPVEQYQVDNPQNYVLVFHSDGSMDIKADCNNARGSYAVDGSSIKIEVGAMTRAMCPPESLSTDFIKHLPYAAIYFFEDGALYIDLMADGGTLKFTPLQKSD